MTQIISLPLRSTQSRMEKWSSSLELHGFAPSSRCLCRCRVTTPTAPSAPCSYSEPSLTTLRVQSTLLGRKHGLLLTHFVFRPKSYPTSCFSGATFSQASRSLLQSQESRYALYRFDCVSNSQIQRMVCFCFWLFNIVVHYPTTLHYPMLKN